MTQVRKRHALVGMKYDRVDLVGEGANGHAGILIAKNRQPSRAKLVRKAMGTFECADCGATHASVTKSATCSECGSTDLNYTEVLVTKKVTPLKGKAKKAPKNDDATNAGQYTFEDEQYDQDNGENGKALGDAVERSVLNKEKWFEVDVSKGDYNPEQAHDGRDVGNINNTEHEAEKEGEDRDDEQERLAETKPTGLRPDKEVGYVNTATKTSDSTHATHKSRFYLGKKKPLKKQKPGLNSFDYGDQGSQEVAESAEQMYRSNSQPTEAAQSRQESTMSKVVVKARRRGRKSNAEGLDIIDHGGVGIYNSPGVKRNGTGTGQRKITNKPRTAVAPPGNPNDNGKRVAKSVDAALPTLEALNLGTQLAENVHLILKSGKPELYSAVMEDFVDAMNTAAGEWFAGSSITKSKDATAQAEDVAQRAYDIIVKASPESEMSDAASEGEDADDQDDKATNSVGKLKTSTRTNKNEKEQTVVGKNRNIFKSVDDDPYAGLHPIVKAKLEDFDKLKELQTQEQFIQKARTLKTLPGFNEEKVAKQLRDAYENDTEGGDYLYQTLSAAANVTKDSEIFKQYGMPGQGLLDSDPMAQANAYADSHISKSGTGPTREELIATYMKDHGADFYAEAKQAR